MRHLPAADRLAF